jgi:hypothetical protein
MSYIVSFTMVNGNFIDERYVFLHELYLWNGVILSSIHDYASSFNVCEIKHIFYYQNCTFFFTFSSHSEAFIHFHLLMDTGIRYLDIFFICTKKFMDKRRKCWHSIIILDINCLLSLNP